MRGLAYPVCSNCAVCRDPKAAATVDSSIRAMFRKLPEALARRNPLWPNNC